MKQVFQRAGCTLLLEQAQQNFPKELFKVKMYRPRTPLNPRAPCLCFTPCACTR